jgi:RsiW-degrading membrane proteinase PrsW (M82 family)
MTLLVIALGPVFIIAAYIYFRDKYEKEPVYLLLLSLLAGALITVPIAIVESLLSGLSVNFEGLLKPAWHAFAVAGFTEEFFKYLAMYILIWRSREFNEKFDGIVYAVFISLGFAGVENVMYVVESGETTGLIRAFTAVPAHTIFGITMGFYFGYAKFSLKNQTAWKIKALIYPVFLHGVYDFILMSGINWLVIFFIVFIIYLYIKGLKKIKSLSDESVYRTDYKLLEQKLNNWTNETGHSTD